MLAWSGRIDPDGNSYVFMHTGGPQSNSEWRNADADKALDDARLVTDLAQRKAIYEKLTKLVIEDEPILYLYHRRILIAHTNKLEGYKQMPDGLVRVIGLKLK
jgi:peptide/nickel transport system substrate-binding protein